MISSLRICIHMRTCAMLNFNKLGTLLVKHCLSLRCIEFVIFNEAYRDYGTKRELGSVWGTSVTVPLQLALVIIIIIFLLPGKILSASDLVNYTSDLGETFLG